MNSCSVEVESISQKGKMPSCFARLLQAVLVPLIRYNSYECCFCSSGVHALKLPMIRIRNHLKIEEIAATIGDDMHGMLIFTDDGPSTVEQLTEEGERRKLLRKRRIELLGEERAKELEEEDYEREEELLGLIEDEEKPEPEERNIEFRELPSKQQKAYRKRLHKSTGFDVGDIPDNVVGIPVRPYKLDTPDSLEMIRGFSKLALDQHNKDNSTKYQLVKVLKANIGGILGGKRGRTYYITFQVKDMAGSGSPTLNLQAIVKTLKGQATVTFSAPEP